MNLKLSEIMVKKMEDNKNMLTTATQDDGNIKPPFYNQLLTNIGQLIVSARNEAARQVNTTLLTTYWHIGRYIVEYEQQGEARATYGKKLLLQLSRDLTIRYGVGFNRSNLQYMRTLYIAFPICTTLSCKLSWSQYIEILKIDDEMERNFYIKQCELEQWNVRELKRQINSMLFHRIARNIQPTFCRQISIVFTKTRRIVSPIGCITK